MPVLPTTSNSKFEASIINLEADIKQLNPKKNNKNDFYRFLLAQNYNNPSDAKVNNDVLIPRSILKRNNPGNLIKDKRL